MPLYIRSDPRDERKNPPMKLAADGETRLRRYRVDAVIYAPGIKEAERRVASSFEIEAAKVVRA